MQAITGLAGSVRDRLANLTSGCQGQQDSVESLGHVLMHMEQVTQTVASCAEENATAGEELRTQAGTLHQVVESMRLLVG